MSRKKEEKGKKEKKKNVKKSVCILLSIAVVDLHEILGGNGLEANCPSCRLFLSAG